MKIEVDQRHFIQVTWCHVRIRCRFRIRFRSGKPKSDWNEWSSWSQGACDENCKFMQLDLQIIVTDLQIIVIGWAWRDCQIRRPTQKESPHRYFAVWNGEEIYNFSNFSCHGLFCKNAWENWIIYEIFSKKFQVKLNLLENYEFKSLRKKDQGWSLQKVF